MSLKAELETQAAALKAYDEQDFEKALQIFESIADTSKIHVNIGLIFATLGEHEAAVDSFNAATELDKYLAVAYFQCGVSNFLLGRFEYALTDFKEALGYLRGNENINYEQLGLKFKLHAAEVFFNQGLCHLYLGDEASGMQDMMEAQRCKAIPEHDVIDDAIRDKGEEYTVFSIPVGILFRPSETKMRNAKTKDYMGKAKLISAADARDEFTTFTGVTRFKQGLLPSGAPLGSGLERSGSFSARAAENAAGRGGGLSRAATAAARVETPAQSSAPAPPPAAAENGTGGIARSRTVAATGAGMGMGGPGMTRGLSLRYQKNNGDGPGGGVAPLAVANGNGSGGANGLTRQMTQLNVRDRDQPPLPPTPVSPPRAAPNATGGGGTRLTEIYDDYLADEPEPLPPNATDRVAQWASKTMPGAPAAPSAAPSVMANSPPAVGAGLTNNDRLRQNIGVGPRRQNTTGGGGGRMAPSVVGSVRRRPSRNNVSRAPSSFGGSRPRQDRSTVYDEDEEGYVSGDYDEPEYGLTKLRVKIHFEDEIRGMTLSPQLVFDDFIDKVCAKFSHSAATMSIKFADEDGNKVSLVDESDYDLALEVARDSAKGKPEGKIEVWCAER